MGPRRPQIGPMLAPWTLLSGLQANINLEWMPEYLVYVNTLRSRQNGRHFADDVFKCIFLNENVWILLKISLKFVPQGPINNIPALVQIMAWRRPGDMPLSEPMMVISLTHICVTRPQWFKSTLSMPSLGHNELTLYVDQWPWWWKSINTD